MNHALPPLESADISFSKERLFIHQIKMFVLCEWRHNIATVIGIWYISAKSESSIYISGYHLMVLYGLQLMFCYVLSNLIK